MSHITGIDVSQCNIRGGSLKNGYSRAWYKGKVLLGHRVAWLKAGRELPTGIELHHLCGQRQCINTNHLKPVTRQEHAKFHPEVTGIAKTHKEATTCKYGHLFDHHDGRQRICLTCDRKRKREWATAHRLEMSV